jgi:hypothetical protein
MTYRFYITIGSSQVEVHPLNFMKTSLVDSQESGEIFYRRKFNGTLRFIGDDFDLIYMVEQVDPCTEIVLTIEQRDSGAATYHTYWEGYFSTTNGTFDLDNCTFDVTPKPYDLYKNFATNGDVEYNILDVTPEVTTSTTLVTYTHNRYLTDVIEYIVGQIEPGATVASWFFNNEYNPVTFDVNKYRYLTIAQKSDIKRPLDSNPATKALMSFNELMKILRTMYNVYYKFDGTTFRIEHLSYWDDEPGLDLRTQASAVRSNKYSYDTDSMPRFETFSFMEARDTNYTKHTISYDEKCTKSDKNASTVDYSVQNVTTDIDYIEDRVASDDTESDIDDSGFVILANYLQDVTPHVYFGAAYENAGASHNYPNSWSYLLRAFFLHGRVLLTGNINDTAVDFISTAKNKKQDIKAIVCYEDNYDPSDYITTELGEDWFGGQKASVKQATIYPDGRVDFMLLYGEETNDDAEMPAQPKIIHCTITDDFVYTTLSEPNIYDTYYWIFYDPWDITATCQEIMIAAGDTYQVDLRDDAGAYKFNTSDDSLDGWTFILNDNEAADESIRDIQCGGAAPPAIPAVPVLNPPSQAEVCGPIHVDWSTSAGATYYQVWRKPSHLLTDVWEVQANPTTSEYYDYEAGEINMTFTYKITACNISGCSADSNEESITHSPC